MNHWPFEIMCTIYLLWGLLLPSSAVSGSLVQTFEFHPTELEISATAGQPTLIGLEGAEFNSPPGTPLLPKVGKLLILPENTVVTGLQILSVEFETLPGNYELPVAQPPLPLSMMPPPPLKLKPEFNRLTTFYPESICEITGQGFLRNTNMLSLVINPIQYLYSVRKLRLATRIKIAINVEKKPPDRQRFADTGPMNYLIITTRNLDTIFQGLARWRNLTGLSAKIRHIEWIVNTYQGHDDAEKMRTYVQYCARDSGLHYLLLGGDTEILPYRQAFSFSCGAGLHPREDSLPCDLYFSALDGTWDYNGNHIYGEPDDSVDLFPDIFVGRVPVRTPEDAQTFVNKILTYERNLINDYQNRALFSGAILWTHPWTDEMIAKEKIKQKIPNRFQFLTLYESQMPVTVDTAISLFNAGFGIFNHCGHGWIDALALSQQALLRNHHIDGLTNGVRLGIAYSIGCWTAAFDFDCIGEHFLLNPEGGGIAYIGNSSYGWGSPGNPGFGYSDRFDALFFELLFSTSAPRIGELLAQTKIHFLPFSLQPNVYRWHQFCINLLGDPAMPIHTDTLGPLYIHKPLSIPTGSTITRVIILDPSGPVNQATVTLTTPEHKQFTTLTRPDGSAIIQSSCDTSGTAYLTVTAPNHRPLTDSLTIRYSQNLSLVDYQFIDSTGDANGYISAGETFTICFFLKNNGQTPLYSLRCRLTTDSPLLTAEQDFGFIPVLPPETIIPARLFLVRTSPFGSNGEYGLCTLTITESTGAFSQFPVSIQFSEPVLKVLNYYLIPQQNPFDTWALFLKITNAGLAPAPSVTGTIFNPNLTQNLKLITPGLIFPPLPPGETAWSLVSCRFTSQEDAVRLGVNLVSGRFTFSDTFNLNLANAGTFIGFDSGLEDWSVSGNNGLWYITAKRFNSEPFSIHPGHPDELYPPNCTCLLVSPKFLLPNRPVLSFNCSYEVPIYGTDGLYCIISTGQKEETLDFIGAGGALGEDLITDLKESQGVKTPKDKKRPPALLTGPEKKGWVRFHYDLSFIPPGESAQLKFVFVSDPEPDTVAGFYLDDIYIKTADSVSILPATTTQLIGNFPNPFRTNTTVFLALSSASHIKLAVYNTSGRVVRTLVCEDKPAGYYSIPWDGTDEAKAPVPAGVYFIRLVMDHLPPGRIQRKVIKIKR